MDVKNPTPPVSIVIVAMGEISLVQRCVKSLLYTDYPRFEIVIVHLGRGDFHLNNLFKNFRGDSVKIKLLQLNKDPGLSASRNIGFKVCDIDTKYIAFLDDDVEVERNWLKAIVNAMETNPQIGIAQGKVLYMDDRKRIQSSGGFMDRYGWSYLRGKDEIDTNQYDRMDEIFFATGCMMIVRRKALESVGLFDGRLFYGYDDVDICWRFRLRGYRVMFVPSALVFHRLSATSSRKPKPARIYHETRSHLLVIVKNHSLKNLVISVPKIVFSKFMAGSKEFLEKDLHSGLERTKAFLWLLHNIKGIMQTRMPQNRSVRLDEWFRAKLSV